MSNTCAASFGADSETPQYRGLHTIACCSASRREPLVAVLVWRGTVFCLGIVEHLCGKTEATCETSRTCMAKKQKPIAIARNSEEHHTTALQMQYAYTQISTMIFHFWQIIFVVLTSLRFFVLMPSLSTPFCCLPPWALTPSPLLLLPLCAS